MSVSVEHKDSILWIYLTGPISSNDLLEGAALIAAEEARHAVTPHRITEISEASQINIGFEEIMTLAAQRRTMRFANPFKSAIVAKTDVQMGFARMFQTLNNNPQIAIRIFPDRASAVAWIASPSVASRVATITNLAVPVEPSGVPR